MNRLIIKTLAVLMLFSAVASAGKKFNEKVDVRVMSQNLYIGADLGRLLAGEPPAAIIQTIQQTDFAARAVQIAKAIHDHKTPHFEVRPLRHPRMQVPVPLLIGLLDFGLSPLKFPWLDGCELDDAVTIAKGDRAWVINDNFTVSFASDRWGALTAQKLLEKS